MNARQQEQEATARRWVTEGRVVVFYADEDFIAAMVRGDDAVHRVLHDGAQWTCSCTGPEPCAAVRAVRLCTAPRFAAVAAFLDPLDERKAKP